MSGAAIGTVGTADVTERNVGQKLWNIPSDYGGIMMYIKWRSAEVVILFWFKAKLIKMSHLNCGTAWFPPKAVINQRRVVFLMTMPKEFFRHFKPMVCGSPQASLASLWLAYITNDAWSTRMKGLKITPSFFFFLSLSLPLLQV